MNNSITCLIACILLTFSACVQEEITITCAIEGRWNLEGFDNTLYEFHEGLRYTIYSNTQGTFGTRTEAIPNPHEYTYSGDTLIIDLNFGNFIKTIPAFGCDCKVVEFEQGGTRLFREHSNIDNCD